MDFDLYQRCQSCHGSKRASMKQNQLDNYPSVVERSVFALILHDMPAINFCKFYLTLSKIQLNFIYLVERGQRYHLRCVL